MMKHIVITLLILCSFTLVVPAQTKSVVVKIAGLTCSQCTRSVEMQLKKLSFISTIQMDLQQTEARITIKNNTKTDFNAIAQAVKNAGFSMAGLTATIQTDKLKKNTTSCYSNTDGYFLFTGKLPDRLPSSITIEFVANSFSGKSKNQQVIKDKCPTSNPYIVQLLP